MELLVPAFWRGLATSKKAIMKIEMLKDIGEVKQGTVIEVSDAQANYWLRVKAAKEHKPKHIAPKPQKKHK